MAQNKDEKPWVFQVLNRNWSTGNRVCPVRSGFLHRTHCCSPNFQARFRPFPAAGGKHLPILIPKNAPIATSPPSTPPPHSTNNTNVEE